MKKLLLSLLFLFTVSPVLHSSHFLGGDVTWECLGNGKFIFQLRLSISCTQQAANAPTSITLSANVQMSPSSRVYPVDTIFHNIYCADDTISCGTSNFNGSYIDYIYRSGEITLSGIPPSDGWWFGWSPGGVCCRGLVDNLSNSMSQTFLISAKMFPYNDGDGNKNTNTCFDNSPNFPRIPASLINSTIPGELNISAIDTDYDSLYYSWSTPLQKTNLPVNWASGFSPNYQLPGFIGFDHFSGKIYLADTSVSGNFTYQYSVESWRKGNGFWQKIAEVNRNMLVGYRPQISSNTAPTISVNSLPGSPQLMQNNQDSLVYEVTVKEGEMLAVNFIANDADTNAGGTPQVIYFDAWGGNLPQPFTGSNCPGGQPCAQIVSLNPGGVFSHPLTNEIEFNYAPSCQNIEERFYLGIENSFSEFYFFKFSDDACPFPASTTITIKVNVEVEPLLAPDVSATISEHFPNDHVQFSFVAPIDTSSGFGGFLVMRSLTGPNAGFLVFDSITDFIQNTFTDTSAHQGPMWFTLNTLNGCDYASHPSNVVSSVWCFATADYTSKQGQTIQINLKWNSLLPHPNPNYEIWKKTSFGAWALMGNSTGLTFVDSIPAADAPQTLYKIQVDGVVVSNTVGGFIHIGIEETQLSPTYIYHKTDGQPMLQVGEKWHNKQTQLIITDLAGKAVYAQTIFPSNGDSKQELPAHLPSGLYLLQVSSGGEGEVFKVRF